MLDTKELSENWFMQSTEKLKLSGEIISSFGFETVDWYKISVPTTVVAGLVANKVFPDPYKELNLKKIPGFKEGVYQNFDNYHKPNDSPFLCSWWFRKEINFDSIDQTKNYWLLFKGINYSANIWINGKNIANNKQVVGTYRQFEFNVTPNIIQGTNVIALEVFSPTPDDLSISFVDWCPVPPDDNMGLWQPVIFYQTGFIKLQNPVINTQLEYPDFDKAFLTLNFDVINLSNTFQSVVIRIVIDTIIVEKTVSLQNYESCQCTISYLEFSQLIIQDPHLWWPYQLGTPFLYTAKFSVLIDKSISDVQTVQFGIREVKSYLYNNKSRLFVINGVELPIRGIGWTPDIMFRQSKERDNNEIALIKNLHINTIRMEGKLGTDYFWNKCDVEGLLVIAGWVCCSFWEKWDRWKPKDLEIAKKSLKCQLFRLRNHSSLICWLYGSDNPPPEHVEAEYLKIYQEVYPELPFLSSASQQPSTLSEITGMKMTGPYTYVPPIYWYLHRIGSAEGFNSEAGPDVCISPWESIIKFITKEQQYIGSEVWNFHLGLGAFSNLNIVENALINRYGSYSDFRDFVKTAQISGYESWRAVFEAYSRNFPVATGFIGWMGNSPWPNLIWHLFDVFYNTNGAYYGTQKACEQLHLQYSYDDNSIWFINRTLIDQNDLKIYIELFNQNMQEIYSKIQLISIQKEEKLKVDTLSKFQSKSSIYFLLLKITDTTTRILSRNFYWLSSKEDKLAEEDGWPTTAVVEHADLKALRLIPVAKVTVSYQMKLIGKNPQFLIQLQNNSNTIAFFLRLIIIDVQTKESILPILWSENCLSLLPFEKHEIKCDLLNYSNQNLTITVDGWNIDNVIVKKKKLNDFINI